MDTYHIWVDLAPGVRDSEFVKALDAMASHMKERGLIEGLRLQRRKLGFGPAGLGEFHVMIEVRNLTQLDEAFNHAAARSGEMETVHAAVFSRICNYKSALYRDFPDPVREI